eukprot:1195493-Prorocentrum_minimum.AAC.4
MTGPPFNQHVQPIDLQQQQTDPKERHAVDDGVFHEFVSFEREPRPSVLEGCFMEQLVVVFARLQEHGDILRSNKSPPRCCRDATKHVSQEAASWLVG